MANDLGTKFECSGCGTKFYDLKRPQAACPSCGQDPREADGSSGQKGASKGQRRTSTSRKATAKPPDPTPKDEAHEDQAAKEVEVPTELDDELDDEILDQD